MAFLFSFNDRYHKVVVKWQWCVVGVYYYEQRARSLVPMAAAFKNYIWWLLVVVP